MPNTKRIDAPYSKTGLAVYVILLQKSTGYLLNDADGAFASAPADPYVSMTEHAIIKGLYQVNESRTAWADGEYIFAAYERAGGTPAPVSDAMISAGDMVIKDDLEVYVDVPVSSRLSGASYTAPDNTGIAAIKAKTDNLPSGIRKGVAITAFTFRMTDTAGASKAGLTITAQRSQNGGALAVCDNAVSEISNGLYKIDLSASDMNADIVALRFTATGAADNVLTIVTRA